MAYYDNDYTSSESEENLELCEQELFTQQRPKNQEPKVVKDWDYRVAAEIVRIHREAFKKSQETLFSNWVNANLNHLQNLHKLSGLDIPEETFYTFIYDHVM